MNTIHIDREWPKVATRNEWSRLIPISPITMVKAEKLGKLKTHKHINGRYVMITREAICKWLKVTYSSNGEGKHKAIKS